MLPRGTRTQGRAVLPAGVAGWQGGRGHRRLREIPVQGKRPPQHRMQDPEVMERRKAAPHVLHKGSGPHHSPSPSFHLGGVTRGGVRYQPAQPGCWFSRLITLRHPCHYEGPCRRPPGERGGPQPEDTCAAVGPWSRWVTGPPGVGVTPPVPSHARMPIHPKHRPCGSAP